VRHHRRHAPHWWPEGEEWGPGREWHGRDWHGRGWHGTRRRFRRRVLATVLGVVGFIFLFGWIVGRVIGDNADTGREGRGPFGLVFVVAFVLVVGSIASARAYRRLGRPIGELLTAADQVAEGDFAIQVEPEGPRELRALATAFNEMAGRLATTDEQRRRFLADVSHELRTPLAVLQSGLEAQLDGIHPRDDQHLASLLEETRRLGRLIGDLHTLALADAGKLVLHREPVELGHLVDDAIAAHLTLAERNAVTLAASVAPDVPVVDVDPARIRQVLDNLLANAVRHSPPSSTVTVEVTAQHGGVQVEVRDAGPGFPPDQLAHVFDRFARAADSQGSGLGLSIARDLVEAHGGTLTARNLPEGGAELTVMFPG